MKAVVHRGHALVQAKVGDVVTASGQILVKTLACGIRGSDLHAVDHLEKMVEIGKRAGANSAIDLTRDLVLGHEFCAESLEHGPDTRKTLKAVTRVVSVPHGDDRVDAAGSAERPSFRICRDGRTDGGGRTCGRSRRSVATPAGAGAAAAR